MASLSKSEYYGIKIDVGRDKLFSEQGLTLLNKYYSDGKEGIQKALARAANCFSYGDKELAQRVYDAASQHWFFFSSPILSNAVEGEWDSERIKEDIYLYNKHDPSVVDKTNPKKWYREKWGSILPVAPYYWKGPKPKAMPIACFLTQVGDTIKSQVEVASELSYLSVLGGGTAIHSAIRAISDKAPGPIPYIKTIDGVMGYYRQGKTRRGSTAVYLDVSHPDILEFIYMRNPSGGDSARRIDNRMGVHLAVNITREFKKAVVDNEDWLLKCPHSGEVRESLPARALWEKILDTRAFTGEPYLYFIDVANDAFPQIQRDKGLRNNGSNLCSEITLATNDERTAVCCLSSLNLEKYDEWKDTNLVQDLVRFLDNVIQWFIDFAPPELGKAVASAKAERAIGLGAMGWHNWLMKNNIPFEGGGFGSAVQQNHIIFGQIKRQALEASKALAVERGEPSDMLGSGLRNSHLLAVAPNSNSSVLCNTSPSIEPIASNAYTQKSRAGISLVKNKYLVPILDKYQQNTPQVWKQIIDHNGSVQQLDFLSDQERAVFKTAYEIDQHWLVQHAEDRQQYICQAQSLNLFFLPGTDRSYINSVHMKAMKGEKVKSLYYFRTGSAAAADTVKKVERKVIEDWKEESVCVSCEG
jgi:ribonucleoside-diphosphate reductase alpha chain